MKPLLSAAKQHFRPLADPMLGEMYRELRVWARCAPDLCAVWRAYGPERGMSGRVQVDGSDGDGEGGPPIIPPSRKRRVGDVEVKDEWMDFAVDGEMAFKSR